MQLVEISNGNMHHCRTDQAPTGPRLNSTTLDDHGAFRVSFAPLIAAAEVHKRELPAQVRTRLLDCLQNHRVLLSLDSNGRRSLNDVDVYREPLSCFTTISVRRVLVYPLHMVSVALSTSRVS